MAATSTVFNVNDLGFMIINQDESFVLVKAMSHFKKGDKGTVAILTEVPNGGGGGVENASNTSTIKRRLSFMKSSAGAGTEEKAISITEKQSATLIKIVNQSCLSSYDDLINHPDLSEATLLFNLKIRFEKNQIFTRIGSLLLSVNPYQELSLFSPEEIEDYKNGTKKTPHVYTLAKAAFESMMDEGKSQTLIISGESGSGKTELTRNFLNFLIEISTTPATLKNANIPIKKPAKKDGVPPAQQLKKSIMNLQQKILLASPILESFGNAKTLRNNNSSRHGKYISIEYDQNVSFKYYYIICNATIKC